MADEPEEEDVKTRRKVREREDKFYVVEIEDQFGKDQEECSGAPPRTISCGNSERDRLREQDVVDQVKNCGAPCAKERTP